MSDINTYRDHISIRESLIEEENDREEKALSKAEKYSLEVEELKERREKLKEAYSDFRVFVKDTLLSEAIKDLYIPVIKLNENSIYNENLANNMVKNFIKESESCDLLFLRNNANTLFIESLHDLITKHAAIVLEGTDPEDPATFKVNKSDVKDFLDDVAKEDDYDEIKETIRNRVCNAEEEFIANAMADKASMDQIITQTTSRIEAIKSDENILDATKDAITNEAAADSKEAMYQVRHRRGKSIFESMVEELSESVYTNKKLRDQFTLENGKVDMGKIVESARCMYGFLELLNTTKLINVDEAYIQTALNELKGDR